MLITTNCTSVKELTDLIELAESVITANGFFNKGNGNGFVTKVCSADSPKFIFYLYSPSGKSIAKISVTFSVCNDLFPEVGSGELLTNLTEISVVNESLANKEPSTVLNFEMITAPNMLVTVNDFLYAAFSIKDSGKRIFHTKCAIAAFVSSLLGPSNNGLIRLQNELTDLDRLREMKTVMNGDVKLSFLDNCQHGFLGIELSVYYPNNRNHRILSLEVRARKGPLIEFVTVTFTACQSRMVFWASGDGDGRARSLGDFEMLDKRTRSDLVHVISWASAVIELLSNRDIYLGDFQLHLEDLK